MGHAGCSALRAGSAHLDLVVAAPDADAGMPVEAACLLPHLFVHLQSQINIHWLTEWPVRVLCSSMDKSLRRARPTDAHRL